MSAANIHRSCQWALPTRAAKGNWLWVLRMGTASRHCRWVLPTLKGTDNGCYLMGTANGHCQQVLPMGTTYGCCQHQQVLPTGAASGCCQCQQTLPMGTANGCCQWVLPTALPTSAPRPGGRKAQNHLTQNNFIVAVASDTKKESHKEPSLSAGQGHRVQFQCFPKTSSKKWQYKKHHTREELRKS